MSQPRSPLFARPGGLAAPAAADQDFVQNFKLKDTIKLKITVLFTDSTTVPEAADHSGELLDKARAVLKARNFLLDVLMERSPLPYTRSVSLVDRDEVLEVRGLAHAKIDAPGRLPVIFCPLSSGIIKNGAPSQQDVPLGITIRPNTLKFGSTWPTFVLVNTQQVSPSVRTVYHEMGHAADLDHEEEGGAENNFMFKTSLAVPQDNMLCCQVAALARAYFAEPNWALTSEFRRRCPTRGGCLSAFKP